ncbi:MAG: hypothetical protein ACRCUM_01345 [Mycoplasmoidaceae bacterium]
MNQNNQNNNQKPNNNNKKEINFKKQSGFDAFSEVISSTTHLEPINNNNIVKTHQNNSNNIIMNNNHTNKQNNINNNNQNPTNIKKKKERVEVFSAKKRSNINNSIMVPKINIVDDKKPKKILLNTYVDPFVLDYFNKFMKVNKVKQTEAMDYILRSFFGIKN